MRKKTFGDKQFLTINIEEQEQNSSQNMQSAKDRQLLRNIRKEPQISQNQNSQISNLQDEEQPEQNYQDTQNNNLQQEVSEFQQQQEQIYKQDEDYLIPQNHDNNQDNVNLQNRSHQSPDKSINKHMNQIKKLNENQSGDLQVQRIIQEVIYNRKQKQRKKQLISSILFTNQNDQHIIQTDKLYQKANYNQVKNTKKDNYDQNIIKNQSFFEQRFQILQRCKHLQKKIKQIQEKGKKLNLKKSKQNNSNGQNVLKKKKLTKIQSSLQIINKRLQNALTLNLKLSRRLKLEKSKFKSINSSINSIMEKKNTHTSLNQESINQESTIKQIGIINNSISSIHKNQLKTFRSYDNLQTLSNKNFTCGECSKKCKKSKAKRQKSAKMKNYSQTQDHDFVQKKQIYNIKSPILLYNSYSIEQDSKQIQKNNKLLKSNKRNGKSNIYIEDDLSNQPEQKVIKNNQEKQAQLRKGIQSQDRQNELLRFTKVSQILQKTKKAQQLQKALNILLDLSKKQQDLLKQFERNQQKIKQFENKYYLEAFAV